MKPIEYYTTNTVEYPVKPAFTKVFLYRQGKVVFSGTTEEYNLFKQRVSPEYGSGGALEKHLDQDAYNDAMLKYRAEHCRLMEEFKNDLFEENGVQDNPKREKCYYMALERGHDGGLNSVATEFADLVDLIN